MKSVVAIRHVAFEDLGTFEPVLRDAGYAIRYCDIALDDPAAVGSATDVLVVLGGPIGAYEDDKYPFIIDELRLIERRMAAQMPSAEKAKAADFVIDNSGAMPETEQQVRKIYQQLLAEAGNTAKAG